MGGSVWGDPSYGKGMEDGPQCYQMGRKEIPSAPDAGRATSRLPLQIPQTQGQAPGAPRAPPKSRGRPLQDHVLAPRGPVC